LAAVCCAAAALPAAADDSLIRVTDPGQLESFGFPAESRHIYAVADRLNQPLREEPSRGGERTDYFGGSASGFSSFVGQSFKPPVGDPTFSARMWDTFLHAGDIYYVAGDPNFQVQLTDIPNGALLQAVRWWASDTDPAQDIVFTVYRICLPNTAAGSPQVTVLASQSTAGSAGDVSGEMTVGAAVDMKQCTYRLQARFGQNSPANLLYKMRVQWVRQVSQPTGPARFIDVPTNHRFFKFVEALASSGITGGCSANQYCPDAPVTRGQMAVFLATALGLNWGGL
jgi:hypothetical protein